VKGFGIAMKLRNTFIHAFFASGKSDVGNYQDTIGQRTFSPVAPEE